MRGRAVSTRNTKDTPEAPGSSPTKWPAIAAIQLSRSSTCAVLDLGGWGLGPLHAASVDTEDGEATMDQFETAGAHDDTSIDDRLSLLEVGVFVFLCVMSVATILTLTLKG